MFRDSVSSCLFRVLRALSYTLCFVYDHHNLDLLLDVLSLTGRTSNDDDAREEPRRTHHQDRLEVSHVAAEATPGDAAAEDTAVVVKVTHAPLADPARA